MINEEYLKKEGKKILEQWAKEEYLKQEIKKILEQWAKGKFQKNLNELLRERIK